MKKREFFDSNVTTQAYLGKHAFDLLTLTGQQAAEIYEQRGLLIPVGTSSTLQFLKRRGAISAADVAKALDLPHQLATQRVEKLEKLGLIRKKADANDGRRLLIHLTRKGQEQAQLLEKCMEDVAGLYAALFEEIDCDLSKKLPEAIAALEKRSLVERMEEQNKDSETRSPQTRSPQTRSPQTRNSKNKSPRKKKT